MSTVEYDDFQHIKFVVEDSLARITINRPDVLNALNPEVLGEIGECFFNHLNETVRVVVIEGAGDKAFVAGADIGQMSEMNPMEAQEFSQLGQTVCQAIEQAPQIVIAKVQGFALGGGCELAMSCDIIIAGKKAKFGQPEVNLGLIPGFGGTQRLVKRVGLPVALDMLTCGKGRTLRADDAFNLGLVSRVVEQEDLEGEVAKVAKSILSSGPMAVSEVKRLAREASEMTLSAGLSSETSAFACCFNRPEKTEGISAFLEKRAPKF